MVTLMALDSAISVTILRRACTFSAARPLRSGSLLSTASTTGAVEMDSDLDGDADGVGQRHQRHHPQARLYVLRGQALEIGEHLVHRIHARRDGDDVMAAARHPSGHARVVETLVG